MAYSQVVWKGKKVEMIVLPDAIGAAWPASLIL